MFSLGSERFVPSLPPKHVAAASYGAPEAGPVFHRRAVPLGHLFQTLCSLGSNVETGATLRRLAHRVGRFKVLRRASIIEALVVVMGHDALRCCNRKTIDPAASFGK